MALRRGGSPAAAKAARVCPRATWHPTWSRCFTRSWTRCRRRAATPTDRCRCRSRHSTTTRTRGVSRSVGFGAAPGCSCDAHPGQGGDGGGGGGNGDGGGGGNGDGGPLNACGDNDPSCQVTCLGPTCMPPNQFPLPSDSPPNPNVGADGVGRDPMTGYIILDNTHAAFDFAGFATVFNCDPVTTVGAAAVYGAVAVCRSSASASSVAFA